MMKRMADSIRETAQRSIAPKAMGVKIMRRRRINSMA